MPLKKTQIAKFKKRLEEMHEELTFSLREAADEVKQPDESAGYSQHQADQGTDDFDRTISLGLTENEYNLLRQIEKALERIEENTYGICELSGEEIPLARLEAMPYATTTVQAQAKFEKGLL